jgi:hypothetical protein
MPYIGEYLGMRKCIGLSFLHTLEAKIYEPEHYSTAYQLAQKLPNQLAEFLYRLTLQENRTAQWLYAFWRPIIEISRDRIASLNDGNPEAVYSSLPLRNIGGAWYHQPPQYFAYGSKMKKLQQKYNLFGDFLFRKIENEPPLQEDGHLLRHASPDGKAQTDDDVILELLYPI